MADWIIRGVPRSLARDLWWLESAAEAPSAPPPGQRLDGGDQPGKRLAALLWLLALADWLLFGQAVGVSLAIFAAAVLAVALSLSSGPDRLRPVLVLGLAALPVVDYVQALSLAILGLGLLTSLLMASGGTGALLQRGMQLAADLPLRGIRDGVGLGRELGRSDLLRNHRRHLRAWTFPLGGALVLSSLLIAANPVLGEIAEALLRLDVGERGFERILFWLGMALLVWPLIAPMRTTVSAGCVWTPRLSGPSALSVARGLVVFNAILGVQTLMDSLYLWGGAALPEGMTAAEYAHRGAYPLLVTALLAGAFALAARPFAAEDRRLRGLLLLWLAQNVALALSALLRLELYVEAFGLTYLRVHAAIWMGLVAAGLGLTAWQVWRGLPNRWLLIRSASLGAGVLYACSFINFAAIIAHQNLARADFDTTYLCDLGPMAAAEIAASGHDVLWKSYQLRNGQLAVTKCKTQGPQIEGWRDWGFRAWRVNRYLDGLAEGVHENPRRG